MTERQKDRKTERQKDRKTERQKDRKTKRQKSREAERHKDRKTEKKDRKTESKWDQVPYQSKQSYFLIWMKDCNHFEFIFDFQQSKESNSKRTNKETDK